MNQGLPEYWVQRKHTRTFKKLILADRWQTYIQNAIRLEQKCSSFIYILCFLNFIGLHNYHKSMPLVPKRGDTRPYIIKLSPNQCLTRAGFSTS